MYSGGAPSINSGRSSGQALLRACPEHSEGTSRTGDEHALAPQHAAHCADVGAHRLAAQQILDPHVAHLLDADAAVQQLVDSVDRDSSSRKACPEPVEGTQRRKGKADALGVLGDPSTGPLRLSSGHASINSGGASGHALREICDLLRLVHTDRDALRI